MANTTQALGMIETRGLIGSVEAAEPPEGGQVGPEVETLVVELSPEARAVRVVSREVTGVSGEMVPTSTDTIPVFRLSDFRIEPGEGLYGNTYGTQGFKGTWDYAGSSAILSGVPEPATWAIMIVGFGMTGATIRAARRRGKTAHA